MKQIPKISDAEWEVMKVFWAKAPLTANDVIQALEGSKDWNPKTIRTLIKRLVEKNAVGYKQEGRNYSYFPLVQEEECVRSETRSFLKRIYGGALKPMIVNFLKEEQLTKEDIEELKRILDERRD
ncbi:BlaI/MecI/CopY family transcriptional regulator [Paenibacillus cisolokensis]|jgi:BlaI family penicillinase repressor|uniref:BlaI/MecI/CopY family transcriptional regulator n=1 Tax=Paenibacillus TaxID=44249 RepID=UPI00071EFA55|nr:BlaI/MecI/CopY family transcriptional regulator [Paenibacillus sp. 32O-W]ALS29441.1 transcriptional regulator [Paenibacillus sp. 32O-W]